MVENMSKLSDIPIDYKLLHEKDREKVIRVTDPKLKFFHEGLRQYIKDNPFTTIVD